MRSTPRCLPLLIALSLLTAGIALASSPTGSASEEPRSTTVVRDQPDEPGPRNLTLQGQVVNASSDEPIEDVDVQIHNRWRTEDGHHGGYGEYTARTNETGHYQVNVSEGEVRLRVDEADYQRLHASFSIEENLTLDLPLEPAEADLALVHGTVTSEGEGPIEGAYVRVSPAPEECPECGVREHHADSDERSTRDVETEQGTVELVSQPRTDRYVSDVTDEEGRYEMRVPDGRYHVRARAQDHLSAATIADAPSEGSIEANLSLTPIPDASVTIEGQVQDAQTDEPIEQARISLDNQRWGTHNATRTGEDGRFSLAIQPGYTTIRVSADDSYYVACKAQPVEEGEGGDASRPRPADCGRHERGQAYLPQTRTIDASENATVDLQPRLEPEPEPSARIEGWAVNASSGEGVPNATIWIREETTGDWGRAETGPDGSYAIPVREGYYTVRVHADGYFTNATNLRVDDGQTVRSSLNLTPGQAADRGCCIAYAADGVSRDVARESTDEAEAGGGADGSPQGAPSFKGGPGELGSVPTSSSTGPSEGRPAPPLGLAGVIGVLASGAALGARSWPER